MRVDLKRTTIGYWINMKGIPDIESIITIYTAIINANSESLQKLGCKDIKAVVSIT